MNFTAELVFDEGWWIAQCMEIPGANGQGETEEEAILSLKSAIRLLAEDNSEQMKSRVLDDGVQSSIHQFALS